MELTNIPSLNKYWISREDDSWRSIYPESKVTAHDRKASTLRVCLASQFAFRSQFFLSFDGIARKISTEYICGYTRRACGVFLGSGKCMPAVHPRCSWIHSLPRFLFNIRRNCPVLLFRTWYCGRRGRRQVGWNVSAASVALRKRSGRALLTGASMRLFDTSSDKRPPYYLPIVVSSSLSSSATAMAAASPCRERFPLIDFWNFPFTYAEWGIRAKNKFHPVLCTRYFLPSMSRCHSFGNLTFFL